MRRLSTIRLTLALLVGLLALPVTALPAGATVDSGAEAEFVNFINAARAEAGLPGLAVSGELRDVARRHSAVMASSNNLHHNPSLKSQVVDWLSIGENVGQGPTVPSLHEAFMNSPAHRDNILYHKFTEVGVGVEVVDGRIWVTEVFRKPGYVAAAPEPEAPAPKPKPEPEPEPEPAKAAPAPQPAPAAPARPAAPQDEPQRQVNEPEPRPAPAAAPRPRGVDHTALVIAHVQAATTGRPIEETLAALTRGR